VDHSEAIRRFGDAARFAAISELRLRLLAVNTAAIREYATRQKLEDVESAILSHFEKVLTDSEREDIGAARKVRNKLLHCEFWTAEKRVVEAGRTVRSAGMRMLNLTEKSSILESIEHGTRVPLREVGAADPRIFGWIMEGATDGGLFEEAEHIFCNAIRAIERLFLEGHHIP
jgi:hypothetical protein